MRYKFKEFEFDSVSLVLTKNAEDLAIRHNEAKVLAQLLEHANSVLSKDDILAHVWQNKVVSEQAIFQNISHLRSLFGAAAIKTYPKRGYQWQLETQTMDHQGAVSAPSTVEQASITVLVQKKTLLKNYLLMSLAIIIAAIYLPDGQGGENTDSVIKIAYIAFTDDQQNSGAITLEDNAKFDFTALTHLTKTAFEVAAELEYPRLANEHPLVLTGEIRSHEQLTYVDFLLKGPEGDWQGQLSAGSQAEVIKQLQQHLQQSFIYGLLNQLHAPALKQAKLSIAHQQAPNDLINLGQLIESYITVDELEKAMVMADKLLNLAVEQQNPQQVGNALLYQSEILTRKELYDLSATKLNLAVEQFEKIDDLKRQADTWFAQSWLDHQQNDYPAIKAHLLKSAQIAVSVQDIARELEAITYLSIMANKHHQENDRYLYLRQAENSMRAYQLPLYQFAKIPFHYAIFANNPSDKEPYYKQVLEFTALTPQHWVAQVSRLRLLEHYIQQERLAEAQVLVDSATADNHKNSYLKTILALAKKQESAFNNYAQRTFEQAQLAGDKLLSLDVALLLCSEPDTQTNFDFYSQYIAEHATPYWRQYNNERLLALNL